ncbi:MAG: MiaB/RimO family radical SAM methylthiotransferase, partial [Planctomycetes bacterium]|nr:MiaB/RimO family radical SAM methylthiotransferase [Planctomycetota bacterium]
DALTKAVLGEGDFTAVASYRARPGAETINDDCGRLRLTTAHTAYLRIAEGCGQRCTFCTIPAIRGPFRSKLPEQVLAEAEELIADGAVELNVIAQDPTSYGTDIGYAAGLAGLLRALDGLAGVRWIRLMYAYPSGVSEAVIDALAKCRHVVKYLDLPLQHIADPVLAGMRRQITSEQTHRLLASLRQKVPGLVLRTTFIVGFPGETEGDFGQLLELVRAFRFDALGVFEYSNEQGTPAAKMDGQVPAETRAARREQLMLAQQEIVFAANAAQVGRPIEVLVDGITADGHCFGRHAGQAPEVDGVCYLTESREPGRVIRATVTGWEGYDLIVRPDNVQAGRPGKRHTKRRTERKR